MDLSEQLGMVSLHSEALLSVENFAAVIAGHHTEFGKIGNLYAVEAEEVKNGILANEPVYSLRTLLGGDNIEIEAGIRYIAGQLKIEQPLTISLTLKNYSADNLKLIVKCIKGFKAN